LFVHRRKPARIEKTDLLQWFPTPVIRSSISKPGGSARSH